MPRAARGIVPPRFVVERVRGQVETFRKGGADDPLEARVLGYLGPGARAVGDIVEGMLVGGDADEYDALQALSRLTAREVVRVERPPEAGPTDPSAGQPPQPELER